MTWNVPGIVPRAEEGRVFFCCRVWFSFEDGAAASSLVVSYKARNFLNMVETIVCVFYYIKGSLNLQLHGTEGVRGPL